MRPPIIDARAWDRLQAKLQANSKGAGVPHDAVPWLQVIYCDQCKAAMYRTVITNRQGRKFSYYRHERRQQTDCRARVRADDVERQIPGLVLRAFNGSYVQEVRNRAGYRGVRDAHPPRAGEHRGGWAEYLDRLATLLAKRQPG